jgi:hypothetical protein
MSHLNLALLKKAQQVLESSKTPQTPEADDLGFVNMVLPNKPELQSEESKQQPLALLNKEDDKDKDPFGDIEGMIMADAFPEQNADEMKSHISKKAGAGGSVAKSVLNALRSQTARNIYDSLGPKNVLNSTKEVGGFLARALTAAGLGETIGRGAYETTNHIVDPTYDFEFKKLYPKYTLGALGSGLGTVWSASPFSSYASDLLKKTTMSVGDALHIPEHVQKIEEASENLKNTAEAVEKNLAPLRMAFDPAGKKPLIEAGQNFAKGMLDAAMQNPGKTLTYSALALTPAILYRLATKKQREQDAAIRAAVYKALVKNRKKRAKSKNKEVKKTASLANDLFRKIYLSAVKNSLNARNAAINTAKKAGNLAINNPVKALMYTGGVLGSGGYVYNKATSPETPADIKSEVKKELKKPDINEKKLNEEKPEETNFQANGDFNRNLILGSLILGASGLGLYGLHQLYQKKKNKKSKKEEYFEKTSGVLSSLINRAAKATIKAPGTVVKAVYNNPGKTALSIPFVVGTGAYLNGGGIEGAVEHTGKSAMQMVKDVELQALGRAGNPEIHEEFKKNFNVPQPILRMVDNIDETARIVKNLEKNTEPPKVIPHAEEADKKGLILAALAAGVPILGFAAIARKYSSPDIKDENEEIKESLKVLKARRKENEAYALKKLKKTKQQKKEDLLLKYFKNVYR